MKKRAKEKDSLVNNNNKKKTRTKQKEERKEKYTECFLGHLCEEITKLPLKYQQERALESST